MHTHVFQNSEGSGQSKNTHFWVLRFQQFLPNGKQSWNVKYLAFEYLFHNLYLSWA